MKAHWLILDTGRAVETKALYEAVERSGREVRRVRGVPDEPHRVFPVGSCVIAYGPMDEVPDLARRGDWFPVAWADPEVFACRTYYAHWGPDLLQRNYVMLPLGEVRRKHAWLHRALATAGGLFIRPDANDKTFGGEVIPHERFEAWSQELARNAVDPATLCVVSGPVPIDAEWRLVIRRGKVLTGSSYRVAGALNKLLRPAADVIAFAEAVASRPFPGLPPIYVLDVAAAEGRLSVVEIGSINSAGYYGCAIDAIISAVSQEAEDAWTSRRTSTGVSLAP